ncbi:MAG: hypothetical protein K6G16_01525 [Lachnospiraceae bacterium]|nr:hypothetical protein [Lachnospiraceae bacterium]
MAYFDSEKNKAIWEKRLAMLEQERDRRKREGYRPTDRKAVTQTATAAMAETKPGVRIITYEQLIAKEEARHKERARAARAARQPEMAPAPQAQAGTRTR